MTPTEHARLDEDIARTVAAFWWSGQGKRSITVPQTLVDAMLQAMALARVQPQPEPKNWIERGMPTVEEIDAALGHPTWHESKMHCRALLTRARVALLREPPAPAGEVRRLREDAFESGRGYESSLAPGEGLVSTEPYPTLDEQTAARAEILEPLLAALSTPEPKDQR